MSGAEDDPEKEKRRRINRDAAARSRQKQKDMVNELKKKTLVLESEKTELAYTNQQLQKMNEQLQEEKQKLLNDSQQSQTKLDRMRTLCISHANTCGQFREELFSTAERQGVTPQPRQQVINHQNGYNEEAYIEEEPEEESSQCENDEVGQVYDSLCAPNTMPFQTNENCPQQSYQQQQYNAGDSTGSETSRSSSGGNSVVSQEVQHVQVQAVAGHDQNSLRRAEKRVARSEEHAVACAKARKIEAPLPSIRHFAKARKAVSPLVEKNDRVTVSTSQNGVSHTSTVLNAAAEPLQENPHVDPQQQPGDSATNARAMLPNHNNHTLLLPPLQQPQQHQQQHQSPPPQPQQQQKQRLQVKVLHAEDGKLLQQSQEQGDQIRQQLQHQENHRHHYQNNESAEQGLAVQEEVMSEVDGASGPVDNFLQQLPAMLQEFNNNDEAPSNNIKITQDGKRSYQSL